MRLSAICKLTDELVEIKGVSDITEDNFTYYISSKYDPRISIKRPINSKLRREYFV